LPADLVVELRDEERHHDVERASDRGIARLGLHATFFRHRRRRDRVDVVDRRVPGRQRSRDRSAKRRRQFRARDVHESETRRHDVVLEVENRGGRVGGCRVRARRRFSLRVHGRLRLVVDVPSRSPRLHHVVAGGDDFGDGGGFLTLVDRRGGTRERILGAHEPHVDHGGIDGRTRVGTGRVRDRRVAGHDRFRR
jgi:hypothetical protein